MSIKIFLSATFKDLIDERRAVLDVIRRMRVVEGLDVDVITMEDFGFSPDSAKDLSLAKLSECDAYLGLISTRYGEIGAGETLSYSHLEYRQAQKTGMTTFILEKHGSVAVADIERDPKKLELLNQWVAEVRGRHAPHRFDNATDLSAALGHFLAPQIRKHFPNRSRIAEVDQGTKVRHFRMADARSPFIDANPSARTIDVCAITALSLVQSYEASLERLMRSGANIRIVMVSNTGKAADLIQAIGKRSGVKAATEAAKHRAHRIKEHANSMGYTGSLQVREIDWVFSATLFIINRGLPDAVGWVGTYTPDFTSSSSEKWFIELRPDTAPAALRFYADQFERMWTMSIPSV